jgi:hypothetical protein
MYKIIKDSNPKYIAASDVLISDMSNIIYEFLIFDRPIILLANDWVNQKMPDVGIKTSVRNLGDSLKQSLSDDRYSESRHLFLNQTISLKDENACERYYNIIKKKSGYKNPDYIFIDGNNNVKKYALKPLIEFFIYKNEVVEEKSFVSRKVKIAKETVFIGAHVEDLIINNGYKVHIEHGLKGLGTGDINQVIGYYKTNNFFNLIDLHITTGEVCDNWTKKILGPNGERTIIGGYPKVDHLLAYKQEIIKKSVCDELGFEFNKPLVVYAPAGRYKLPNKAGGSLSKSVLKALQKISKTENINLLIKLKYTSKDNFYRIPNKILRTVAKYS